MPILTPASVARGVGTSRILFDAGLRLQEITLRTRASLDTIAALRSSLPGIIVGAGSVLTPELGDAALKAGASFLVSPGTTDQLLRFAIECPVPFLPGAATPSELMRLQAAGCTAAKVFPIESLGGIDFLRSLGGPLPSMKLCPTGGIDARLARQYLELGNVLAIGGSWMAPDDLIANNQLADIRRLAEQAAAL